MYEAHVGVDGLVSLAESGVTGELTAGAGALVGALQRAIGSESAIFINFQDGSIGFGNVEARTIDMMDVIRGGPIEPMSSATILAHEIVEQVAFQEPGAPMTIEFAHSVARSFVQSRTGWTDEQGPDATMLAQDTNSGRVLTSVQPVPWSNGDRSATLTLTTTITTHYENGTHATTEITR